MSSCLGGVRSVWCGLVGGAYVGPIPPLGRLLVRLGEWWWVKGGVPGDDKVVAVAHPANGLDDLRFVVFNDFDPLQILGAVRSDSDTQGEGHLLSPG